MNKDNPSRLNRRNFLRHSSGASLLLAMGGIPIRAERQAKAEGATEYTAASAPVNCAIIGCGSWGRELAQTLTRLPNGPIRVLCDSYEPALRRIAKSAPEAETTTDYRRVLANSAVQAVLVATPTPRHREIAVAALEAGKHLYCEAPLGGTVEDARAIAQAAERAWTVHFQTGLQNRADPQVYYLLNFIRTGVIGAPLFARSQWHKRQQWRFSSPSPERERELNWRLEGRTSPGLIGEIGIHQMDLISMFMAAQPLAVSGSGSILSWPDGRDVPDTVHALFEYPAGVTFLFDATLGNSFDSAYDVLYGTESAILWRDRKGWMFKEPDARLLGWEVYARKEVFYKDNGIVLGANATQLTAQGEKPVQEAAADEKSALERSLEAFLQNAHVLAAGVEDFRANFGANDPAALKQYLGSLQKSLLPCAGYKEGYEASVAALKANEAISRRERIALSKELYVWS